MREARYARASLLLELTREDFSTLAVQRYFLQELAEELGVAASRFRIESFSSATGALVLKVVDKPGDTPLELLLDSLRSKSEQNTLLLDPIFGQPLLVHVDLPAPPPEAGAEAGAEPRGTSDGRAHWAWSRAGAQACATWSRGRSSASSGRRPRGCWTRGAMARGRSTYCPGAWRGAPAPVSSCGASRACSPPLSAPRNNSAACRGRRHKRRSRGSSHNCRHCAGARSTPTATSTPSASRTGGRSAAGRESSPCRLQKAAAPPRASSRTTVPARPGPPQESLPGRGAASSSPRWSACSPRPSARGCPSCPSRPSLEWARRKRPPCWARLPPAAACPPSLLRATQAALGGGAARPGGASRGGGESVSSSGPRGPTDGPHRPAPAPARTRRGRRQHRRGWGTRRSGCRSGPPSLRGQVVDRRKRQALGQV